MIPPVLAVTKNNIRPSIINWKGLNQRTVIGTGELASMTNICSDEAPCLSPRPSREEISTYTSALAAFPANGYKCTVDNFTFTSSAGDITFGTASITSAASAFGGISAGDSITITGCTVNAGNNKTATVVTAATGTLTFAPATFTSGAETAAITFTGCSFKYNGVTKGAVTATAKSMCDFNGKVIIAPDGKYYDYGTDTFSTVATWPGLDYIDVLNNRIWGVKDSNIYASALGQYNVWDDYSGDAEDSYATDVAEEGDFTGIKATQNYIILSKRDYLYEVYGDKPSNFQVRLLGEIGCLSDKSMVEINHELYYLNHMGVYVYSGDAPRNVSLALNETYISGVAGTDGRKYYLSLYNGTEYNLYVYDTFTGVWCREDDLNVKDFLLLDTDFYALTTDTLYKFDSGTEDVNFEFETERFTEQYNGAKVSSEFNVMVEIDGAAMVRCYSSLDGGSYTLSKTILNQGFNSYNVQIKPARCNSIQLKFSGFGSVKIHELTRSMKIGSALAKRTTALTFAEIQIFTWAQLQLLTWNELYQRR